MLVHIPEQDAREYAVRVSGRAQAQLAAIYRGDVDDHPSPGEDGRFVVWLPGSISRDGNTSRSSRYSALGKAATVGGV